MVGRGLTLCFFYSLGRTLHFDKAEFPRALYLGGGFYPINQPREMHEFASPASSYCS